MWKIHKEKARWQSKAFGRGCVIAHPQRMFFISPGLNFSPRAMGLTPQRVVVKKEKKIR